MTSTLIDRLNGVSEGLAVKAPVRCATTANITLAGLQTIDGVAVSEGNRVLVCQQTDAVENGIYKASTGNWTRTPDLDGARDVVQGTRVAVAQGTTNGELEFKCTSADPITIGTSALTFVAIATLAQYTAVQADVDTAHTETLQARDEALAAAAAAGVVGAVKTVETPDTIATANLTSVKTVFTSYAQDPTLGGAAAYRSSATDPGIADGITVKRDSVNNIFVLRNNPPDVLQYKARAQANVKTAAVTCTSGTNTFQLVGLDLTGHEGNLIAIQKAGNPGLFFVGTIQTVSGANQDTITTGVGENAGDTLSGASCLVAYGPDDSTAFNAVKDAVASSLVASKCAIRVPNVPGAGYIIGQPITNIRDYMGFVGDPGGNATLNILLQPQAGKIAFTFGAAGDPLNYGQTLRNIKAAMWTSAATFMYAYSPVQGKFVGNFVEGLVAQANTGTWIDGSDNSAFNNDLNFYLLHFFRGHVQRTTGSSYSTQQNYTNCPVICDFSHGENGIAYSFGSGTDPNSGLASVVDGAYVTDAVIGVDNYCQKTAWRGLYCETVGAYTADVRNNAGSTGHEYARCHISKLIDSDAGSTYPGCTGAHGAYAPGSNNPPIQVSQLPGVAGLPTYAEARVWDANAPTLGAAPVGGGNKLTRVGVVSGAWAVTWG